MVLVFKHPDGGVYRKIANTLIKDDDTGNWVPGVSYQNIANVQGGTIYTTTRDRWSKRFTPASVPADQIFPAHWPMQSFDARDWAKAFMDVLNREGVAIDESLMVAWFANSIMRGYDEHGATVGVLRDELATKDARIAELEEQISNANIEASLGE